MKHLVRDLITNGFKTFTKTRNVDPLSTTISCSLDNETRECETIFLIEKYLQEKCLTILHLIECLLEYLQNRMLWNNS